MELYQLKTFIAVSEEGHLTRAAERLHTSQPAVSAHIKALEEELGLLLFERTSKGMLLTAAGQQLKLKAQAVAQAADDLRYSATQLKGQLTGVLRLGLHIDPQYLKLSELLAVLRQEFPGITLHYLQKNTWEAPPLVRSGNLDAAFLYGAVDDPDMVVQKLDRFALKIVGPPAWKARLQGATMADIAAMPWVWIYPECPLYEIGSRIISEQGCDPLKAVIADQEVIIRNLVSSGVGLSLMMEAEAREAARNGQVLIVADAAASLDLSFVYLQRRAQDPLIKALLYGANKVWPFEGEIQE